MLVNDFITDEIEEILQKDGFTMTTVLSRKAGREHLSVVKFVRKRKQWEKIDKVCSNYLIKGGEPWPRGTALVWHAGGAGFESSREHQFV